MRIAREEDLTWRAHRGAARRPAPRPRRCGPRAAAVCASSAPSPTSGGSSRSPTAAPSGPRSAVPRAAVRTEPRATRVVSLPDPALVVLVGASGSGKSTWAASRYRDAEVVSSDALRAVVGSGEHDLDASTDAFALLEQVVAARLGRRLTTVVDTLGTDATRRRAWRDAARAVGLPAVAVVLDTPASVCRSRNAARDRPVPARVLTSQLASVSATVDLLEAEGWQVVRVGPDDDPNESDVEPARASTPRATPSSLRGVVLQLSRFPAEGDLLTWLRVMAAAAEEAGLAGLALMDHLIQIPQVGRAWEPIPEPWVTLGALATVTTRLRLGTLVTPVTFRAPGITAKAGATLSALSSG